MTQAKAQTVAAAVIGAGYACKVFLRSSDSQWVVRVYTTDGFTLSVATVDTFDAGQGVSGFIAECELV